MLVTTGNDVAGHEIVEYLGLVRGIIVRATEISRGFVGGLRSIGALMTCGVDYAAEELVRPSWMFERTQTLMQGAAHGDFRWKKGSNSHASD